MIEATFAYHKESNIAEWLVFELKGHADYNPGQDVVCAGVSAISEALTGYIETFAIPVKGKRDFGHVRIEALYARETVTVFFMALIGLLRIEKSYPKHIQVVDYMTCADVDLVAKDDKPN